MIIEREARDGAAKDGGVVRPLAAQVVDAVPPRVVRLKEALHLWQRVAEEPLAALRREAHGDDARRDVRQVQVVARAAKATLLKRHDAAHDVEHRFEGPEHATAAGVIQAAHLEAEPLRGEREN